MAYRYPLDSQGIAYRLSEMLDVPMFAVISAFDATQPTRLLLHCAPSQYAPAMEALANLWVNK